MAILQKVLVRLCRLFISYFHNIWIILVSSFHRMPLDQVKAFWTSFTYTSTYTLNINCHIFTGELMISQVPVICRYLGQEFRIMPENLVDQLHAEEILYSCHQCLMEGRSLLFMRTLYFFFLSVEKKSHTLWNICSGFQFFWEYG